MSVLEGALLLAGGAVLLALLAIDLRTTRLPEV